MEVNHSQKEVEIKGEIFVCNRGESYLSHNNWAKKFGSNWNRAKVIRYFKLLEKSKMICTKNVHVTTHLRVSNYAAYQDIAKNNRTHNSTSDSTPSVHQADTNNHDNHDNQGTRGADSSESPAPSSKSKTLKNYLDECEKNNVDAIPTDSIVFTNADKLNLPHGYVLIAWEHFKNHWLENKSNARKTNWVSTFNNCLKDSGYSAYQRNQNGEWYLTTKGKNTKILNGIAA